MTNEMIADVLQQLSRRERMDDVLRKYNELDLKNIPFLINKIKELTCQYFELVAIDGQSRKVKFVMARSMFCTIIRNTFNISFSEIGSYLGGRDHSTVMYNIQRHKNEMRYDDYCYSYKNLIEHINLNLNINVYGYEKNPKQLHKTYGISIATKLH